MRGVTASLLLLGALVLNGEIRAASESTPLGLHTQQSRNAQSNSRSSVDADTGVNHAADWGLKPEEWVRYRQLMHGPVGIVSPNLDPLTALGIEARSDEERRHYAELQVRTEGRRVEKLLAYQRAYDEAWKRLFPALKPVRADESTLSSPTNVTARSEPGRFAVFVKAACPACDERVKALQASGRAFDLYMVGSLNDDSRIRQWAARVGIDPAKVRSHLITLNHDAGRWLSLSLPGGLPAVVREANGQWQRE